MPPVRDLDDDAHKEHGSVFKYENMNYIMDFHHKHTLSKTPCQILDLLTSEFLLYKVGCHKSFHG